ELAFRLRPGRPRFVRREPGGERTAHCDLEPDRRADPEHGCARPLHGASARAAITRARRPFRDAGGTAGRPRGHRGLARTHLAAGVRHGDPAHPLALTVARAAAAVSLIA